MAKILTLFTFLVLMSNGIFSQESRPNAAILIKEILIEQGIDEAQKTFDKILLDSAKYILSENEFNVLGYQLARQRKLDESLAILKMNIQAFPNSWNVYDSYGEMLSWSGNKDVAIENFEKSLELNPENENAVKNLNQIYGDISDHEKETKLEFQFAKGASTGIMEPYFGEEPPGLTPRLFAPGIISTLGHFEFACTFSPDGKEYYFTRRADKGGRNVIMVSSCLEDGWTAPDTAEFSKEGWDHEPHISPDGKKLYFGTTRIKPGEDSPSYGIWVLNRSVTGWSDPEFTVDGMYASATLDGSLYVTDISGLTEGGIIKFTMKEGAFGNPVRLGGGVNDPENGIHPFISPDEDFLLFDCYRKEGYGGEGDIYVAFRDDDDAWSDAYNLGEEVNGPGTDFCASLSPDGKYIFYTKNRDIYWVSSKIIFQMNPF